MTVCVCLCCAERESYIETLKRATYCWPQALDRCVCVFLSVCLCECMCVCVGGCVGGFVRAFKSAV